MNVEDNTNDDSIKINRIIIVWRIRDKCGALHMRNLTIHVRKRPFSSSNSLDGLALIGNGTK